jgi:hypothetical protein
MEPFSRHFNSGNQLGHRLNARRRQNKNMSMKSVNENVLEQNRANLVRLAPLNIASVSAEDLNNISEI